MVLPYYDVKSPCWQRAILTTRPRSKVVLDIRLAWEGVGAVLAGALAQQLLLERSCLSAVATHVGAEHGVIPIRVQGLCALGALCPVLNLQQLQHQPKA